MMAEMSNDIGFCFVHGPTRLRFKEGSMLCLKCNPGPVFEDWFPDLEKWVTKQFEKIDKEEAQ